MVDAMKINLNDYVKVKLTEEGLARYKASMYHSFKDLDGDILKIQFWQLMNIYGQCMYNGNNNLPFESMDVEVERAS